MCVRWEKMRLTEIGPAERGAPKHNSEAMATGIVSNLNDRPFFYADAHSHTKYDFSSLSSFTRFHTNKKLIDVFCPLIWKPPLTSFYYSFHNAHLPLIWKIVLLGFPFHKCDQHLISIRNGYKRTDADWLGEPSGTNGDGQMNGNISVVLWKNSFHIYIQNKYNNSIVFVDGIFRRMEWRLISDCGPFLCFRRFGYTFRGRIFLRWPDY